jgi:hypothetical protein
MPSPETAAEASGEALINIAAQRNICRQLQDYSEQMRASTVHHECLGYLQIDSNYTHTLYFTEA